MENILGKIIWRFAPLLLLKLLVRIFGSFRSKKKLGNLLRPYYAYSLISAADRAKKRGIREIWALEFGVAVGRGLRILVELARQVEAETGVKVKVAGFGLFTFSR